MNKLITYRYEILWTLLLISLPFSKALINIVLALSVLLCFYDMLIKRNFEFSNYKGIYVFFAGCIYLAINAFFSGGMKANESFFKLYPIVLIGYLSFVSIPIKSISTIKKVSVIVCLSYVLTCLIRIFLQHNMVNAETFGNSAVINHLLIIDRPYAGCFVLLNVMLASHVYKEVTSSVEKKFLLFTLVTLIAFLVLIAARLSLITLLALTVIYFVFYSTTTWLKKTAVLVGIPLVALFFIYISSGLQQRLFINNDFEVFKDYEPRFVIWDAVFHIISSDSFNMFTGIGNYVKIDHLLVDFYTTIPSEEKRAYYLKETFNTHNQFFDWMLFGGMLALLFFVAFFGMLFQKIRIHFTAFALVFTLILFMMFENVFHRQVGCYLFFMYLIIALKTKEKHIMKQPF